MSGLLPPTAPSLRLDWSPCFRFRVPPTDTMYDNSSERESTTSAFHPYDSSFFTHTSSRGVNSLYWQLWYGVPSVSTSSNPGYSRSRRVERRLSKTVPPVIFLWSHSVYFWNLWGTFTIFYLGLTSNRSVLKCSHQSFDQSICFWVISVVLIDFILLFLQHVLNFSDIN